MQARVGHRLLVVSPGTSKMKAQHQLTVCSVCVIVFLTGFYAVIYYVNADSGQQGMACCFFFSTRSPWWLFDHCHERENLDIPSCHVVSLDRSVNTIQVYHL